MQKYINLDKNRYLLVNDYPREVSINYKLVGINMWGQCVNNVDYNFFICEYSNGKDTLRFRYATKYSLLYFIKNK